MDLEKQSDKSGDDTGSQELLGWLLFVLVLGLLLIYCSHLQQFHASPFVEFFRDLGIALCISVVVARLIELSLSRRIFLSGLDAIMNRTVPPEVWEEFRQHVITQPMMRTNWNLTMKIGPESGQHVSTTRVKYTIVSLKDSLKEQVIHQVDLNRAPAGHKGSVFTKARIGSHSYGKDKEHTDKELMVEDFKLKCPVEISKNKATLAVEVEFKEKIGSPDIISWWMSRITQNLKVTIEGLPSTWSVEITTSHPAKDKLKKTDSKNEWKFIGIMLPGQGIEIQIQK